MDGSPSKRRKLTPEVGIVVDASRTAGEPTKRDVRTRTTGSASFMSPTKSSLARFNPDLLPSPKSVNDNGQRLEEEMRSAGVQKASSPRRLNAVPLRPTTPNERSVPIFSSPTRSANASPRRTSAVGGRLSSPARRRTRTPSRLSEPPTLPSRRQSAILTAPTTGLEISGDAANTQLSMELEATVADGPAPNTAYETEQAKRSDLEEPELPPTPEHLGLKPKPSPPKGLMFSSPTARKSKRKVPKSSPLKPSLESVLQRHEEPATEAVPDQQADHAVSVQVLTDTVEEADRKQQLRRLITQSESIQADEVLLADALTRISNSDTALADMAQLISMMTSKNPTHDLLPLPPKPRPLSRKLSLFLPFARVRDSRGGPKIVPQALPPSYDLVELDKPPLKLRNLYPLAVVSTEAIVESPSESGTILLRRELKLDSPNSLLSARLRLAVDAVHDSLQSLTLEELSPWAQAELGSWIQTQARTEDASMIGWACSRYWDLSLIRARVWAQSCERYSHLLADPLSVSNNSRHLKTPQRPDRKDQQETGVSLVGTEDDSQVSATPRSGLRMHLGRQALLFQQDGVTAIIKWNIEFDWTGEVSSKLALETTFPEAWRAADGRKSFCQIPRIFGKLVKERSVSEAIRIIVRVLWP